MVTDFLTILKKSFNNRISFREKGVGIYQIVAPFYHEDGDMYDMFFEYSEKNNYVKICDHGLTLMRLSYTYELDTPKKNEIFCQIISDNKIENDNGNLFIESTLDHAYNAILRFTQVISKITNMSVYRREVVRSLFFEDLKDFVNGNLMNYFPKANIFPILEREDLEVDYCFNIQPKKVFLFGVKDNAKARLVAISCLEYLRKSIPFRSLVVHEDFDALSMKDRRIITNVVDKQFTDLNEFKANAIEYFERESA